MERSFLNQLVCSSSEPPAGFLLAEAARKTLLSPTSCRQLSCFLLRKLERGGDDPYIPFKCLRVIKHCCRTGAADFKRDVQRNAECVRKCLTYRAPPHPIRGDAPSRLVREEAAACLEAVFECSPSPPFSSVPGGSASGGGASAPRIEGFGVSDIGAFAECGTTSAFSHSADSSPGYPPAAGFSSFSGSGNQYDAAQPTSRMAGFGNPYFTQAGEAQSSASGQRLKALAATATRYFPGSFRDRLGRPTPELFSRSQDMSGRMPAHVPPSVYTPPTTGSSASVYTRTTTQQAMRTYPPETAMPTINPFAAGLASSHTQHDSCARLAVSAGLPGPYESKLVETLLEPGGARLELPASALDDFVRRCESLDIGTVALLLLHHLENRPVAGAAEAPTHSTPGWKGMLRALCALEALLLHLDSAAATAAEEEEERDDYSGPNADLVAKQNQAERLHAFLRANALDTIQQCQRLPQLRQHAQRVLHLLQTEAVANDEPTATCADGVISQQQLYKGAANQPDLLGSIAVSPTASQSVDLLELEEHQPPPASPPPPADLLELADPPDNASTNAPPAASKPLSSLRDSVPSLFEQLQVKAQPSKVAPSEEAAAVFFQGLNVVGAAGPVTASSPPTAQRFPPTRPAATGAALDDLLDLGDASVTCSQPQQPLTSFPILGGASNPTTTTATSPSSMNTAEEQQRRTSHLDSIFHPSADLPTGMYSSRPLPFSQSPHCNVLDAYAAPRPSSASPPMLAPFAANATPTPRPSAFKFLSTPPLTSAGPPAVVSSPAPSPPSAYPPLGVALVPSINPTNPPQPMPGADLLEIDFAGLHLSYGLSSSS
eukprot:GHVT01005543.1.p1 GENE.GHVT01005543.1~~GHVT01005543.1.p1  ORF type:complete len:832 (+),score=168.91 GHVT01005543.1:2816-5311(+)